MRIVALGAAVLLTMLSCSGPEPNGFAVYHGGGGSIPTHESPFVSSSDGMFVQLDGHTYDISIFFDYLLSDRELIYADTLVYRGLLLDDGRVKIGGLFCRVSEEFIDCTGALGGVRAPRGGGQSDTNVTRVHAFPASP